MLTSDKLKSFLSDRPKIIKIHQVKRDGPELNRVEKNSTPPQLFQHFMESMFSNRVATSRPNVHILFSLSKKKKKKEF